MTDLLWFILFWIILNASTIYKATGVSLTGFENCHPNIQYPLTFNVTITTTGGQQYVDGTVILLSAINDTIRSNFSVAKVTNRNHVHLFSASDGKSCNALHKYLGEFIYDFERRVNLIPGACPIPKGKYQVHNAPLNYEKIPTLANFPLANLLVTGTAYERNNNIFGCIIFGLDLSN